MDSLQTATDKIIKEDIEGFHFLLKETDLETAKRITLEDTILKPVIEYVNNYNI